MPPAPVHKPPLSLGRRLRRSLGIDYAVVVEQRGIARTSVMREIVGRRIVSPLNVYNAHRLPHPPGDLDYPRLARRAADLSVAALSHRVPGLFTALPGGCDLSRPYRAWLTQMLLQKYVPKLGSLRDARRISSRGEVFIQTAVPLELATEILGVDDARTLKVFSAIAPQALYDSSKVASRWLADSQDRTSQDARSDVAFLVGTPREAAWMLGLIEALPPSARACVVLKKDSPALAEYFARNEPTRHVSVDVWDKLAHGSLTSDEHRQVADVLGALMQALASSDAEPLRAHGAWIAWFYGVAIAAIGLARKRAPRVLVGSLEKAPAGMALSELAPQLAIRTLNIQHGNIARQETLDLLRYDCFGIWREPTRALLLADGYAENGDIRVVGRPPDEPGDVATQSAEVAALRDWLGGRRAISVFLQPVKAPYVSIARLREMVSIARSFVGDGKTHALLVKPHPSTPEPLVRQVTGAKAGGHAVRIVGNERSAMASVLAVTDIAVSMSSTALQDARRAGRRAIAFDPDGFHDIMQLDLPKSIEKAKSADELLALLADQPDAIAREDDDGPDFTTEVQQAIRDLLNRP